GGTSGRRSPSTPSWRPPAASASLPVRHTSPRRNRMSRSSSSLSAFSDGQTESPRRTSHVGTWLPAVCWMLLITIASADRDSGPRGARLLGPLLRWLLPSLAEEAIDVLVLIARKLVHFVVFGILALLILRGLAARAAG